MAEIQKSVEASFGSCHSFQITTALLWSTSSGTQPSQQITLQEAHLIDLHCDRILAAARAFSWPAVLDAFDRTSGHQYFHALLRRQVPAAIEQSSLQSIDWKIRILVSQDGNVKISPAPIILRPVNGIPRWPRVPEKLSEIPSIEVCLVLIDSVPTPASDFTTHKTNSRKHYDEARSRCNIEHDAPTESEVLLFNEDHEVMEASLCTPYFLRNGQWITPALSSGGNAGVSRRVAFNAGLCVEKTLHIDELIVGEIIWLSNAVRGFMPGRIQLLQKWSSYSIGPKFSGMLYSALDMASNSTQTFVKLTLDLNSKTHASAPGVLSILGQVVEAPHNYDLHLRVMLGTSVLEFSFTGLENLPALVTGGQPDLVGSTMTPETDARQTVEDAAVGVNNHIPSSLDSEDTESLNSDEPIARQRKWRRKDLFHHAVSNEAYGETESDDSPQLKSNKRRKLRKNRPAKGAYLEPPKDAHDIFDASSDFEKLCSQPAQANRARDMPLKSEGRQFGPPRAISARDLPSDFEERHATQSKVPRAPKIPTPQKTPFPQKSFNSSDFRSTRTGTHGHKIMREMPDVYMGLNSNNNDNTKINNNNNNLDAVLAQNGPVARPSRKNAKRSRSPKRSRSRTPLPCTAQ